MHEFKIQGNYDRRRIYVLHGNKVATDLRKIETVEKNYWTTSSYGMNGVLDIDLNLFNISP